MPHFIFNQQISAPNILNMLYNLQLFSSKCRLFHNATLFGFCITHILNTECAKIWRKVRSQRGKQSTRFGLLNPEDERTTILRNLCEFTNRHCNILEDLTLPKLRDVFLSVCSWTCCTGAALGILYEIKKKGKPYMRPPPFVHLCPDISDRNIL